MSEEKTKIRYQKVTPVQSEMVWCQGMAPAKVKRSVLLAVLEEPYRVFFPLAIAMGILGVLVWPLFYGGVLKVYPLELHFRLMSEGFVGGFILGFLGTAGPRFLSARALVLPELSGGLLLFLGAMAFHLLGYTVMGDALFGGLIVALLVVLGVRVVQREDVPPPGFVLAAIGILAAVVGAGCLVVFRLGYESTFLYRLGVLFVSQALTLLPILGVGGYVLPAYLGLPGKHAFPDSRTPPPGWKKEALWAIITGVFLIFSYLLEAMGRVQTGNLLRAAVSTVYLLRTVPLYLPMKSVGWLSQFIRIGLICVLAGPFFVAFFPMYQRGGIHASFIVGVTCVTLGVATRAVLGHAGKGFLFKTPLRFFIAIALGLIGSFFFRLGADHVLAQRMWFLALASFLWMIAVLIWVVRVMPNVRVFGSED